MVTRATQASQAEAEKRAEQIAADASPAAHNDARATEKLSAAELRIAELEAELAAAKAKPSGRGRSAKDDVPEGMTIVRPKFDFEHRYGHMVFNFKANQPMTVPTEVANYLRGEHGGVKATALYE